MRELNGESALPTPPSHASSEAPAPGAPPASPARPEQDEHIDLEALAARAGIAAEHVIPYGRDVAKIDLASLDGPVPTGEPAHYVVITAMTPTSFGEGKSTVAIGLAQGLAVRGERPLLTLRQSAMGPTFGIKGGAGGSGRARILPAERMNLHLTGDFHAITVAHNLLAAVLDNHLHHGNALRVDERTITWPRVLDVNDRALRHVVIGLGGATDGVTRQSSFDITPASEVMVIMSLATSLADLRARLGGIVVARDLDGHWVTAEDLHAAGAMAAVLRDALQPNLLRTGEGAPALIHTGPFGNIATGCSSVIADLVASRGLAGADGDRGAGKAGSDAQDAPTAPGYVLTEAGFGADMGLERFFDLKRGVSGMRPEAAVLVVTVRALKAHSGRYRVVSGKDLCPPGCSRRTSTTSGPAPATCCATSRSSAASASSPSSPSTSFPRTTSPRSPRSSASSARPAPRSPRSAPSPRVVPAAPSSPTPSSPPAPRPAGGAAPGRERDARSTSPRTTCAPRSGRWPPCTAPTASTTPPPPRGSSTGSRRTVTAASPSSWPRRRCHCPRTPRSRACPPADGCP